MFYSFLGVCIPFLLFVVLKSKKALHMLQQNWYNDDQRYIKWIMKNPKKVFLKLEALFFLFIFGKYVDTEILLTLFFAFYAVVIVATIYSMRKEQVKKSLVITKRVRRIIYTTLVLYVIVFLVI